MSGNRWQRAGAPETAEGIVQRAIGSGTWSRQDAADFAMEATAMRGEDSLELRRELSIAINEDRVKVEVGAEFR